MTILQCKKCKEVIITNKHIEDKKDYVCKDCAFKEKQQELATFPQTTPINNAQQQKEPFAYKPSTNSCDAPKVTNQHQEPVEKTL